VIIPQGCVDVAAVAAHYDDLDDLYRSLWGANVHHGYWIKGNETTEEAVMNLTRLVAEQAWILPGDRVCDIGCGYGATALTLNRDFGAVVTGITVSKRQYQHAKSAAAGCAEIEFLLCDALKNDLSSGSFDVVIAIESSEHMADKANFFRETHRLLKRGGRCVVTAWLTRERPRSWESKRLLEPICAEGRLPSMASAAEYQTMLGNAGFRDVNYLDLTRQVKRTWSVCARRVTRRFFTDPSFRRTLTDPHFANRVFAKTVFRIWLAYRIGAMRYGCFSAQKSASNWPA